MTDRYDIYQNNIGTVLVCEPTVRVGYDWRHTETINATEWLTKLLNSPGEREKICEEILK